MVILAKGGGIIGQGKEEGEDLVVWTCGTNEDGELGQGTHGTGHQKEPVQVKVEGAKRVRAGGAHTILETKDGNFFVWGWNERNSMGIGESIRRCTEPTCLDLPVLGTPELTVVDFVASWYDSMMLLSDGSLLVWGDFVHRHTLPQRLVVRKGTGEAGEGRDDGEGNGEEGMPVKIAAIGTGYFFSWVLSEDGDLFTWGSGLACGVGSDTKLSNPTLVEHLKWRIPNSKKREWASVFLWLFLGKSDMGSEFSWFPVEVIYNFVQIEW
jgi:alpha-tubulin suppressor-like RCC1 family protein